MLRSTVFRASRTIATQRAFSTSRAIMAGETGSGSSRVGGERAGDAFTKRESAQEEIWVREEEKRKLAELRAKLDAQEKHIKDLKNSIDGMMKKEYGGGEQH